MMEVRSLQSAGGFIYLLPLWLQESAAVVTDA